jgi:hypothetical protein
MRRRETSEQAQSGRRAEGITRGCSVVCPAPSTATRNVPSASSADFEGDQSREASSIECPPCVGSVPLCQEHQCRGPVRPTPGPLPASPPSSRTSARTEHRPGEHETRRRITGLDDLRGEPMARAPNGGRPRPSAPPPFPPRTTSSGNRPTALRHRVLHADRSGAAHGPPGASVESRDVRGRRRRSSARAEFLWKATLRKGLEIKNTSGFLCPQTASSSYRADGASRLNGPSWPRSADRQPIGFLCNRNTETIGTSIPTKGRA